MIIYCIQRNILSHDLECFYLTVSVYKHVVVLCYSCIQVRRYGWSDWRIIAQMRMVILALGLRVMVFTSVTDKMKL